MVSHGSRAFLFPVHVVERTESYDRVSRNRFVSRYSYHHGYFDGVEREFRGFGRVDQFDTEEIGSIRKGDVSSLATNLDAASFVPPIHTKTWFHTGAFIEGEKISRHFEHDTSALRRRTIRTSLQSGQPSKRRFWTILSCRPI